jgi:hypothetical protein
MFIFLSAVTHIFEDKLVIIIVENKEFKITVFYILYISRRTNSPMLKYDDGTTAEIPVSKSILDLRKKTKISSQMRTYV